MKIWIVKILKNALILLSVLFSIYDVQSNISRKLMETTFNNLGFHSNNAAYCLYGFLD